MRNVMILAGLALALGVMPSRAAAPTQPVDEKAIRLAVGAFTHAYNHGDAKALAALFTAQAEIVNDEGKSTQGRGAIEQVFAALFQEHPKSRIENSIQSIRFVSPAAAVEEGISTVVHEPGEPAERSRYVVVHVKQDGKWQMASARETPDEDLAGEDELKQLEWLIGDWVDESQEALVLTSYHWTDNRRYILGEFTVQIAGRPAMTGSQRIGWDPLAKKIRCWVFDSEGGFAEGLWTRRENQWIAKMTGVTREGKAASSTNIFTRAGKDRMTWQSRDRVIGGETVPDIEAIPTARKPPKPGGATNSK